MSLDEGAWWWAATKVKCDFDTWWQKVTGLLSFLSVNDSVNGVVEAEMKEKKRREFWEEGGGFWRWLAVCGQGMGGNGD